MASIYRQLVIGFMIVTGAASADAQGWQNLDVVDAAVASAVGANGAVRPVDRRMKLANCPEALSISAVIGGSLSVACATFGWRIRIPVAASGVASTSPLLVRKGDPIVVVTSASGFIASISGIADGEGRLGDRMRVKTGPGGAVVVGIITNPGTVRIY